MRNSCRPSRDRKLRREIRFAAALMTRMPTNKRVLFVFVSNINYWLSSKVKKLQVMLRQANDQLERTMTEKQSLEESMKAGNEETAAKVETSKHIHVLIFFYPLSHSVSHCGCGDKGSMNSFKF